MIRRRIVWLIALVAFVTLAAVGAVALTFLPEIVRQTAVWRLEALTKRHVTIERVELSLATGHVAVHGLHVAEREGSGTLARVARIEGRLHRRSLWRLHVWIEDLAIAGTEIRVIRLTPTRFNISDLLEGPSGSQGRVALTIDRLRVSDSAFYFEDRTLKPARTWAVEQIAIDGRALSTTDAGGSLEFRSVAAGAPLHVRAEEVRLAPYHVRANISAANVDLGLLRLYLPGDAAVLPERGVLAAGVTVVHDAREGIRISAGARVRDVALARRGQEGAFATSPEMTITLNDLFIKEGTFALGRAEVEGDVSLAEVVYDPPLRYDLARTHLVAEDVGWPSRRPGRVSFTSGLPGGASLDVRGTIVTDPARADLAVRALRIPLDAANRYARLVGTLGGVVDVDARVVAALSGKAPTLTVTGSVGGTRLLLADPARPGEPPLRIERLDAGGIEYEHPSRLTIGLLHLRRPWAHIERDAAGAITLGALFARRDAGAAPAPREAAAGRAPELTAGELRVQEGALTLVDGTRSPATRFEVATLGLVLRNATWPPRQPAQVNLDATLAGGASLAVRGTIAGNPTRADLAVRALRVPLEIANPYARLAGSLEGVVDADTRVVSSLEGDQPKLTVTGSVGGTRLAVVDPARPGEPPLRAERLDARRVEYEYPSRLRIGRLSARRPSADLERDAAGALTLGRLFARRDGDGAAPPPEDGGARPALDLSVGELRVQDGALTFVDGTRTPAPRFEVTTLGLEVKNLTWPARGPAQISLDATLGGGGSLHLAGSAGLDRRNARLTLTARDLDVAQAQPYLPFRGLLRGRVEADLDVRGRLEPFRARVRGTFGARDVALDDGGRSLLTIARVDVTGIDYRAPAQVRIDDVHVVRPFALIERDERGELSLRHALAATPPPAAAPAPEPAAGGARPDIFVQHVLVEEGGTNIVDAIVEPAARFQVRGSRLEVRNLTYPVRMPAEVALATPMPRGGRLEGRGTFQVEPARMDVSVTLADVALAPVQPYLPVGARVAGKIDGHARISGAFEPFALTVRGGATVKDLAVGDTNRELLTASRARADGVDVQWPGGVRIARVELERPWVLLEREASGAFPLIALLTPRTRAAPPPPPVQDPGPRAPAEPLQFELGTLALVDGFGRFVDRTAEPRYAEELSAVNLVVRDIGTTPQSTARTALSATLGPSATLAINGRLGRIGAPLDFDVLFTLARYGAPRTSPYLLTLFGWEAPQGAVTLAARYRVTGDDLEASNDVGVDGLEVVKPPDCCARPPKWPIALPLDLFVSILKDRRGHIELSLPVHGRLSSPQFDLGDAIWSALRGLAIKTVALPFSLVGKLFFTEDSRIEALSFNPVVFVAGTATPAPGMSEHLGRLAAYLADRPAIHLRLRPVLTLADAEPLKRQALRQQLQARAKDGSEAALREQALRVFTRRFPRREPPAALDDLLAALATETRPPAAAEAALATARVTAVRDALAGRGVDRGHLAAQTAAPAVETEGTGRVEFEMTQ